MHYHAWMLGAAVLMASPVGAEEAGMLSPSHSSYECHGIEVAVDATASTVNYRWSAPDKGPRPELPGENVRALISENYIAWQSLPGASTDVYFIIDRYRGRIIMKWRGVYNDDDEQDCDLLPHKQS